jgi:hypothetical protein
MKSLHFRILFFAAAAFLALGTIPAFAQAPLEPAQLPSRTVFYLIWHGVPAPDVRKANALMALWDDADFAPVRSALASNILSSSQEKSPSQKLTPEELQEYASLLENGFTLGYLAEPAKRSATGVAVSKDAKPPAWNGMFFVYDRTGKVFDCKAILGCARKERRARRPPLVIGGVPVLKVTQEWRNVLGGSEQICGERRRRFVMEQILGQLNGKSSGLRHLRNLRLSEAQSILGSGVLEFLSASRFEELASVQTGGFKARVIEAARRNDPLHDGHLALDGSAHICRPRFSAIPLPERPSGI